MKVSIWNLSLNLTDLSELLESEKHKASIDRKRLEQALKKLDVRNRVARKVHGASAHRSYDEAWTDCNEAVRSISAACRRRNLRYSDTYFDLELDLKTKMFPNCLIGLRDQYADHSSLAKPRGVKRVHRIFSNPEFYIEGAKRIRIREERPGGNCWLLAALCGLGSGENFELIERLCVARDEAIGIYGFVFYRDGQWIYSIVDDKLYLKHADYDESSQKEWAREGDFSDAEEEYRKIFLEGSRALYFAKCPLKNEIWLPLLEKAFAKAHGHYNALYGGLTG